MNHESLSFCITELIHESLRRQGIFASRRGWRDPALAIGAYFPSPASRCFLVSASNEVASSSSAVLNLGMIWIFPKLVHPVLVISPCRRLSANLFDVQDAAEKSLPARSDHSTEAA